MSDLDFGIKLSKEKAGKSTRLPTNTGWMGQNMGYTFSLLILYCSRVNVARNTVAMGHPVF